MRRGLKRAARGRWRNGERSSSFPSLRAFSGVPLVLLGLELLDTVKVYFREQNVRVEVILLVGLIAMGQHVLEIDLHHIEP